MSEAPGIHDQLRNEDRLLAAAKRYHEVSEQLRQNATRSGWGPAMARDALLDDLKRVERELHEAADTYGKEV